MKKNKAPNRRYWEYWGEGLDKVEEESSNEVTSESNEVEYI